MVILEFDFKSLNDKIVNSASSPSLKESQNVRGKKFWSSSRIAWKLEREGVTSL